MTMNVERGGARHDDEPGNNIGDVKEGRRKKDFFYSLVLAFNYDKPDDQSTNRNCVEAGQAKEFKAAGYARELGHHVAKVGDQDSDHHEERDAEAKFLPDEVAEPLAGHGAHARGHFLHDDQRYGYWNDRPQQHVAELRPGRRVRPNAAGIVVDVRSDD